MVLARSCGLTSVVPLLAVFKRKAEQVLIDTALKALKARVEP